MSLQFNVAQLLMSEVGETRSYEFEADRPIDLDDAVADGIHGTVKFTLTNFGILARGEAHATVHQTCARCLEPCQTPTHVTFEEEFSPTVDIVTGLASSAPRSDTAFIIGKNHTLNLTEALRQDIILAVDLIPLCRPDCRGLCPTCGVNRNVETCACPAVEPPNPFAALNSLLPNSE